MKKKRILAMILAVASCLSLAHTMKLVGASWGFIRRPFLRKAVLVGVVSALLADGFLGGCHP